MKLDMLNSLGIEKKELRNDPRQKWQQTKTQLL